MRHLLSSLAILYHVIAQLQKANLTTVRYVIMLSSASSSPFKVWRQADYIAEGKVSQKHWDLRAHYSFQVVCGVFNVPQIFLPLKDCETGPKVCKSHQTGLKV